MGAAPSSLSKRTNVKSSRSDLSYVEGSGGEFPPLNSSSPMTHSSQTISPLRQRMIDDMTLRKLNPRTQEAYTRSVIKLTRFLGHSPDSASPDDLRRFQLHLAQNGVSNKTINATITGMRFFFQVTLDDHQALCKMSTAREPRKLPVVLSPDEVKRLLEATSSLKYKAALATA